MVEPLRQWCKRRQPLPNPNDFAVSETPYGILFSLKAEAIRSILSKPTHPLSIVQVSKTSFKVLAGSVAGFSIALTTVTGVTTTKCVYVNVTQGYSSTVGIWTPSAAALANGGSYPSAGATTQVVRIGIVTCASSVITNVLEEVSGSQMAKRTGNATTYADENSVT